MKNSIYFISDAHLGSGNSSLQREKELCALLDEAKASAHTVVLLGDIFDFWFSYKYVVPRGHIRLLGKLAELADAGITIHYFIGNHDMWMFDYLSNEIGAIMHDDPDVLVFDGKRFLIGHGDGLGHLDKHYDFLRSIFRSHINQRLFALLPEWMTFGIATRWSDSNKEKHKREDLSFKGESGEGIILYCKEHLAHDSVDYCVFGHRHTPLSMYLSGQPTDHPVQYVNVGDWFQNRTYAVFHDGTLELKIISKSN